MVSKDCFPSEVFGTGSGIFVSTIKLAVFETGFFDSYCFKSIGVSLSVAFVSILIVSTRYPLSVSNLVSSY